MDHLANEDGRLRRPEDRTEHVRLVMDLMGVNEAEANFIVSIERDESPGDVYIASNKNDRFDRGVAVEPVREPTPVGRP